MMKNRKTGAVGLRISSILLVILLSGFFSVAGLGYVWHRNRNEQIRAVLRQKHVKLEELRAQNKYLERHLEDLRSFRSLESRARELNLGLVMPLPEQILRLPDWPAGSSATSTASPANREPRP
jgi:cell division protein FtsB